MSEKRKYLDRLKAELKTWASKVDELRAKVDKANLESRMEHNRKIAGMYGKIKAIELIMNELENTGKEPDDSLVRQIESHFSKLVKDFSKTDSKIE